MGNHLSDVVFRCERESGVSPWGVTVTAEAAVFVVDPLHLIDDSSILAVFTRARHAVDLPKLLRTGQAAHKMQLFLRTHTRIHLNNFSPGKDDQLRDQILKRTLFWMTLGVVFMIFWHWGHESFSVGLLKSLWVWSWAPGGLVAEIRSFCVSWIREKEIKKSEACVGKGLDLGSYLQRGDSDSFLTPEDDSFLQSNSSDQRLRN